MVTTPKRPTTKGHPRHPKPPLADTETYATEYQGFIQEWHAILDEPPRTIEQLRHEYDDALSFLLLLESRINLLEQAQASPVSAREAVAANAKIYYLSARSRTAKEESATRQAKRTQTVQQDNARPLQPPYSPAVSADPKALLEFMAWVGETYTTSDLLKSQTLGQRQATTAAYNQLCRSIIDHAEASRS